MKYQFILQDNNRKSFGLFARFIFFFHIAAAAIITLNTGEGQKETGSFFPIAVFFALGVLNYSFRKQRGWADSLGVVFVLYCFIFWQINVGLIAAFIILAVFVLAMLVKKSRTFISFSPEGALLSRVFTTTKYPWIKLNNVILKDGLLTIDLVSNKVIQIELALENEPVDEVPFNLFCKQYLSNKN